MLQLNPGKSYGYGGTITTEEFRHNTIDQIDVLTADLQETNVKELRALLSQAQEKPYGMARLLWLQNAYSLSDVIQNTLLKIVEEPPASTIIVVQTNNGSDLLPTLRSRLHFVGSSNVVGAMVEATLPDDVVGIQAKLTAAKDRDNLRALLIGQINYLKNVFLEAPTTSIGNRISLLSISERRLKQNCNQKLVIDQLLLHWNG